MRILIVNDHLDPDHLSVARLSRQQASFLAGEGHAVALLGTVRQRDQAGERIVERKLEVRLATSYPHRFRSFVGLYNPAVLSKFSRFVQRFQPEVVHFHNVHTFVSFAALGIARRHGAKVWLTAPDVMLFWEQKLACYDRTTTQREALTIDLRRNWQQNLRAQRFRYFPLRNRWVHAMVERNVQQVIAVSDRLQEALRQNGFNSVVTLRNGLAETAMDVEDSKIRAFRERYKLKGKRVILFGGRLSKLKGTESILQSLTQLNRPDVRLLMIGSGSSGYERALEEQIERLNIGAQVVRTGWLVGDEMRCAYALSDLCVNPSLCFETLSMFNLESSLAGKPVVSTFFGGASETIINEETGLLVNPYNVDNLLSCLVRLLDDQNLARDLGQRGRQHVLQHFNARRQMERLLELYHSA